MRAKPMLRWRKMNSAAAVIPKKKIDSHFKIQDLAIRTRTSDDNCREALQNNRHHGCSRPSENLAYTVKEKAVPRHRVIHARTCEHALAEETERGDCDCDRNPLRTALDKRDP